MSQKDFLARLMAKLEDSGIPYMISGSLGSSLHGEPRATHYVLKEKLSFVRFVSELQGIMSDIIF
jgi:hypothetical protein